LALVIFLVVIEAFPMESLSAVPLDDEASAGFLLEPLTAVLGFRWVTFDGSRLSDWPLTGEMFVVRLPLSGSFVDNGPGEFLSLGGEPMATPHMDMSLFT
jgi:hypothetical protein